ncbi:hypothetical protein BJ170DRAFT_473649 [Xylariales sp. AK1849]|nr:hypothetical protein BJ170DRAFT_473649 [Xylariales sp. AK1849]
MGSAGAEVIQWIIDTRDLWPEAVKTAQLEDAAPEYLALLTPEEKAGVLKYFFVRDAKMSLASHLLKHFVLSKTLRIPWSSTKLSRDANKKPIFLSPDGEQPVHFNVSHQNGIVALAAVTGYTEGSAGVGVDVVCVNERQSRDYETIRTEGWASFVDTFSGVFGRSETVYLKGALLGGQPLPQAGAREEEMMDFKLRKFYTLWCLREAYVKMTGEALLAEWLPDLEFQKFHAPEPASTFQQGVGDQEETIMEHEVLFKGKKVDDANICLRSLGKDYMTCTAIRTPSKKEDGLSWHLGPFETLDIASILRHVQAEVAES